VHALRILHIERNVKSLPEDPRYDLIDAGRHGEEAGFACAAQSLTVHDIEAILSREGLSPDSISDVLRELKQTGSAQVQASPRIGPNIVRAWFDTVLNPAIRALDIERGLLQRRNWTFAFSARALELIQPLGQRFHSANLEQFREMNPVAASELDKHDALVAELQSSVTALFDDLVADREFVDLCDSLLAPENLGKLGILDISEVFGAYRPDARYNLIAEYVVNNTGELPAYYATAKLWNGHRDALLECLTRLPRVTARYTAVVEAAEGLKGASGNLETRLRNLRQELSLRYDVPLIPPDGNGAGA
jgi:hypothetical protein